MNNTTSLIYFILIVTMLFSYGSGRQRIDSNKKCRQIDGNFDCHGNAVVRCRTHQPIEHIQGFIRSHWMLPLGEFLRCIAPAAAMVKEFELNTQNANKRQLLTSNYGTFRALVVCENFIAQNGPSTRSSMQQAAFKCETP